MRYVPALLAALLLAAVGCNENETELGRAIDESTCADLAVMRQIRGDGLEDVQRTLGVTRENAAVIVILAGMEWVERCATCEELNELQNPGGDTSVDGTMAWAAYRDRCSD